jgi:hypothetical protein
MIYDSWRGEQHSVGGIMVFSERRLPCVFSPLLLMKAKKLVCFKARDEYNFIFNNTQEIQMQ